MRMASLRSSVGIVRQQVRLQVEHDLQAMLDLPQEGVVLFQERPLLVVRQPHCSSCAIASSVLPVRSSGRSPPLSNCRNWMTNSMSRMPPWPVFTLCASAPSRCVRCSIRRLRALMPVMSARLR